MQDFLRHLPAPLILGTLVGIFFSVYRHNRTSRLRFWLLGWSLVFLHFLMPILSHLGTESQTILDTLDSMTLQLAGLAFTFSLAPLRLTEAARWRCYLALSLPLALFCALAMMPTPFAKLEALLITLVALGGVTIYHRFCVDRDLIDNLAELAILAVMIVSVYQLLHGHVEPAFYATMMTSYGLAGLFVVRNYWRSSPAVIVTSAGLFAWAAVWFVAAYFPQILLGIGEAGTELWNVPKFVVAFGMILILLEDESLAAQAARDREHAVNRQIGRFAEITSQLLQAADVQPFCEKIAQVLTEEGNFQRVMVLLAADNHRLYVAGQSGLNSDALAHAQVVVGAMNLEQIAPLSREGRKIGKQSAIVANTSFPDTLLIDPKMRQFNAQWHRNDALMVPLQSHGGYSIGCFLLDEPRDLNRIGWEELTKIEMMAADLAAAMDRTSLQRQLVQREKLVGIGQLVGGVAHELNNPLTAVLGYTELMSDYAMSPEVARDLGIVRREANRMKRIIENLLRFSRQSRTETTDTDLTATVQEVLVLRDYDLRAKGVALDVKIPEGLPVVAFDQSQLKIVLSNLISNAIDAVQDRPEKNVCLEARDLGKKVLVTVTDTGPGFTDVNRIFDPFFTTKKVGRGMGLGLSICYGIMRQFGGEIHATNVQPSGACVSLEMPVGNAVRTQPAPATL